MVHGDIETFYEDGKWHNRVEGSRSVAATHDTQREAVEHGRQMAAYKAMKGDFPVGHSTVEHIIRGENGEIIDKDSFPRDSDPRSTQG